MIGTSRFDARLAGCHGGKQRRLPLEFIGHRANISAIRDWLAGERSVYNLHSRQLRELT